MSAAVVQSARIGSAGQQKTVTVTLGVAATAGNLLVAFVAPDKSITSFDAVSGWNGPFDSYVAGSSISGAWYWKTAAGGETGATFTITSANNRWIAATIVEVSGADASPIDQHVLIELNATTGRTMTPLTSATSQADELALAFWTCDSESSIGAFAASTDGFTDVFQDKALGGSTSCPPLIFASKSLSATGTVTTTMGFTGGSSDNMVAALITIKSLVSAAFKAAWAAGSNVVLGAGVEQ